VSQRVGQVIALGQYLRKEKCTTSLHCQVWSNDENKFEDRGLMDRHGPTGWQIFRAAERMLPTWPHRIALTTGLYRNVPELILQQAIKPMISVFVARICRYSPQTKREMRYSNHFIKRGRIDSSQGSHYAKQQQKLYAPRSSTLVSTTTHRFLFLKW
jgi:hypothetical protein